MKIKNLLPVLLLAAMLASANATTVVPPTFDQLVQQAELVFQGTVTDVKSVWEGQGGQRHIATYVTFQIGDNVKGDAGTSYTIRMLGGKVGDDSLVVEGAPKFQVGDREILFVEHNYDQFVPLVGIDNGRFHVQRDEESGRDIIVNDEGEPVKDVAKLGREEQSASATEAISPEQLKSAVKDQLKAQADRTTQ
ncbi:MAG TPA: hypothetical protein VH170_05635 [Chthoniobacterales bacterium]|jgi:hypothetical protein|nr:hypothetical protein [Chthoniobacterales bacterium]